MRSFRQRIFLLVGASACVLPMLWMYGFPSMERARAWYPTASPLQSPPPSMQLSDVLFPVAPAGYSSLIHDNHVMLHSLFRCIERRVCHENQTKVVILASAYFRDYVHGSRGGESIWARSTILALTNMGYTFIYTPYPSYIFAIQYYQMFPELVKIIFVDSQDSYRCFDDIQNCSLSDLNPSGIPPWKMISFEFWTQPQHPLGDKWTVSPEDYASRGISNNTYLGYSIEETCRKQPFIPHSERENHAYVLAKYLSFFVPERDTAWRTADFDAASAATGIKFILASLNDAAKGEYSAPQLPSEHVNLGPIGQPKFMDVLSRSRVLVGLGNPVVSPSPYDALCLGVPFINPVSGWDHENPSDKSRWHSQHDALQELDPPYVYNVFKGDTAGFVQAFKDALSNPIDSYVPERATMSAVEKRLAAIVERDWAAEAEAKQLRADNQ